MRKERRAKERERESLQITIWCCGGRSPTPSSVFLFCTIRLSFSQYMCSGLGCHPLPLPPPSPAAWGAFSVCVCVCVLGVGVGALHTSSWALPLAFVCWDICTRMIVQATKLVLNILYICTGPSCFTLLLPSMPLWGGGCPRACLYASLLACANQIQNGISLSTPPLRILFYVPSTLFRGGRGRK